VVDEEGGTRRRLVRLLVATALAVAVVLGGLPVVSGASWAATWSVLRDVSAPTLLLLTLVWLAGLWVHTVALVAALPGLSPVRALHLNLTGSAASNVLPLGGAAGTAVNYWSCRRWGFTAGAFIRWALVTNLWDNALRLVLPAVAVSWLAVVGTAPTPGLRGLAGTGLVLLAGYLALMWALLHRSWSDRLLGRVVDRLLPGAERAAGRQPGWVGGLPELRRTTRELLRHSALRVAFGKAAYAVAQALLLWLCLGAVGVGAPVVVVVAAFAVERLASLAVLTPGGSGLAEVGAVGVLVGFGLPGAAAVAAVLVYRTFVFLLEIPVGFLLLAGSAVVIPRRTVAVGPSSTDAR
jgi:uncharacterized protein (TIRG00374 family)